MPASVAAPIHSYQDWCVTWRTPSSTLHDVPPEMHGYGRSIDAQQLTGVARFPQVRLAKGILCAGLHLYFNAYFPVDALESAWFPRMSFLQR